MFPRRGPVETVNFAVGIPLNAFLIYLVRRFSRKELGVYKHLLTLFAVDDIFLSVVEALFNVTAVRVGTIISVVGRTFWETRHIACAYVACYSLPFFLTNLNFLYRYWVIQSPDKLQLFSSKSFQVALILAVAAGSAVWYTSLFIFSDGGIDEPATIVLRNFYAEHFNVTLNDGWIVLDYWPNGVLSMRPFIILLCTDIGISIALLFTMTISTLTFYHIHTSTVVSEQTKKAQRTVLIALCVQTIIPMFCVYLPYLNNLNAPFFDVDDIMAAEMTTTFVSAFPILEAAVVILMMKDYRLGALSLCCGSPMNSVGALEPTSSGQTVQSQS